MPRKMQLFHQLYEKIAETFLAEFICEVLYALYQEKICLLETTKISTFWVKISPHLYSPPNSIWQNINLCEECQLTNHPADVVQKSEDQSQCASPCTLYISLQ